MKIVRLPSGLLAHRLTQSEQNAVWDEIMTNVSPVGKYKLYTPKDNLEYFINKETEIKYDSYVAEIFANGKTFNVKYNICNQDQKINKAVRAAYGK